MPVGSGLGCKPLQDGRAAGKDAPRPTLLLPIALLPVQWGRDHPPPLHLVGGKGQKKKKKKGVLSQDDRARLLSR